MTETWGIDQEVGEASRPGLVLKNYGGFYYVQDQERAVYSCRPRGKVKERILSGDRVWFQPLEAGQGVLENILPRQNELYRPRVANVSLVLIVMAHRQPKPDLSLLDRLLVLAEYNHLRPVILLNKCDLPRDNGVELIEIVYPPLGYSLIFCSCQEGTGVAAVREQIRDEIAVLSGPSGVGKSSLLAQISGQRHQPPTQAVSKKIGRGKHTTRHTELFPLAQGGWLVDTPGFSVLELPRIEREDLRQYLPEFRRWGEECRFGDCLHHKEQDCAVKAALERGEIADHRYKNYLNMLEEVIENERDY